MITVILLSPISANRYWRTHVLRGRVNTYVSTDAKEFKKQVALIFNIAGVNRPITGRVSVRLKLYPHRPLDYKTRMRKFGTDWDNGVKSIDLDNAIKVTLDSMKGIAFDDDVWVWEINAQRLPPDDLGARVVVEIRSLEE